jgi:hypothetical protein
MQSVPHWSWQVLLRTSCTTQPKRVNELSRMYCIHSGTASDTSPTSCGRSCRRKSWQWLPVSQCSNMCRLTKQSTIHVQTLTLNCLLLVSTWYHFRYNSKIRCFWTHVDTWYRHFLFFLYVALMPKVSLHLSVMFYITPWPLVCKRTIPIERPPLVDEI